MPLRFKSLPPKEFLQECFVYNQTPGALLWKLRPDTHFYSRKHANRWNTQFAYSDAGSIHHSGYRYVTINAQKYTAHRIVWKLHHGTDPILAIDHIDTNKDNNSIANLRVATTAQNNSNNKGYSTNKLGLKGVGFLARINKFQASIGHDGKIKYLGCYDTKEEAHIAYCKAADELHGEFARYE